MHRYKNVSESAHVIIGVGEIQADEVFETDIAIENPNFEYIGETEGTAEPAPQATETETTEIKETE